MDRTARAHFANELLTRHDSASHSATLAVAAARFDAPRTYQRNLLWRLGRMSRQGAAPDSAAPELLDEAEQALKLDDEDHPTLAYVRRLRKTTTMKAKT